MAIAGLLKRLRREGKGSEAPVELAAARRRYLSGPGALLPYNPDDLARREGLEVYDRMQTDAQIAAALVTKKFAALSGGWRVTPASERREDVQAAQFCHRALEEMKGTVEDALYGVLDALAKGYSVAEMNFARVGDRVGLASIKQKDPALFEFETDEYLNITALVRIGTDGDEPRKLPVEKFIIYTYMPTYADPRGRSDLRSCYRHWWTKDVILRFFASYLERFGSPVVKGTYRRGATRAQQEDLLRILDRIQQETAIVIPEDVTVDLLQAGLQGEKGFLEAIAYHDRQMAKAILGETLTQEEGLRTGALALAKVHQDTLKLRLQKIKRDLEETVAREQILRPLTRLNFAGAAVPRFELGAFDASV
ncbi:MAG: DUF935 family protein [Armatimonadetes bacterium]|nr:DUF935 family protein [Armatimonadota bacterium]